jgi:L-alanine-DL-glutamate epimerase-like enolase superfamily enzyme
VAATIARASASLLHYTLDTPVGGSGVSALDVILVDLEDADGATGLGFSYVIGGVGGAVVLAAARLFLSREVVGKPVVPPAALWRRIASRFNRTGLGPNLLALAAIDVAAWDLDARSRGVALGVALGGVPRAVPLYGSGGFAAGQPAEAAAEMAAAHSARGLTAVKPRMQGGRADVAVLEAVRAAVPAHVHLMADANEKCDMVSARWLLAAAHELGVLFVEEPLPASAVEGYRALAMSGGAAVAAGEHLQGQAAFLPFVAKRLVAVAQPDLAMAGGLTPVVALAGLCEAFDVSMAPHFLPGLFVHVAAASPAVTWLEEFPLLEPLFHGWPSISAAGTMAPTSASGHGLIVPPEMRARFALS